MLTKILTKIFDVIVNKLALPIALLCAILLFLPRVILNTIEVSTIVDANRGLIWIIFILSSLCYFYDKGKALCNYSVKKISSRKKKMQHMKMIISNLDGLTPQENAWIYYCLKNNIRTLSATEINNTAISLEQKGIACRPSTSYSILDVPFTIPTVVWDYLQKNVEKFCPNDKINDSEYNKRVTTFISNLHNVL